VTSRFRRVALPLLAGILLASPVHALDYRSVASASAILYDAPSSSAKRIYVVGQYYPVEVVVSLEAWAKVRDSTGELAWIEKKNLSDRHTVLVAVPLADVRQSPDNAASVVFQAEQGVALEVLENASSGWVKVRHRDGQSGFVKINQVWGA
jgi:SH3-like domain-containing protein